MGSSTIIRKQFEMVKPKGSKKEKETFDISITDMKQSGSILEVTVSGTGKAALLINGIHVKTKAINGTYTFKVDMTKKPHLRLLYDTGKKFFVEIVPVPKSI